jgi:TolB-like protein
MIVLHFAGLSGDRPQQYFAAGIAEKLMIDLSPFGDILVIPQHTAAHQNKPSGQGKSLAHKGPNTRPMNSLKRRERAPLLVGRASRD